jgi:hypothetical protein
VSEQISQRELRNDSARIMRTLDLTPQRNPHWRVATSTASSLRLRSAAVAAFRGAPRVDSEAFRSDLGDVADQEIPDHCLTGVDGN